MSDAVAVAPEAPAVHTRRFQVRRLPGAPLGAEILGLNDAAGLSDADVAAIRQAWLAHDGLLVFRDVRLALCGPRSISAGASGRCRCTC
ncbi:TauD/TfdA family dioxygenase [Ralstonia solanacearum]|nr:TauD/TfdA family dioxygenase [Ralstonia solanacearum]BEU52632.1 hypothetical protein MAFF211520_29240 [Ralstonia pseudosolanacearum]NJZ68931.1 TauD/TfdA family dioxygenase [Ralstonia solanacearum]NJZ78452.1 TauD/TfdA family dioxygenase [Ralstonia solanacearum]NJZ82989.1 TauD/TfdA family dioxygenase [Ralstonia solanacearum]